MVSISADPRIDPRTVPARARLGLIIPSVNSVAEPQFNRYAPPGLSVHVARARVAGSWKRPLPEMAAEISTAAALLADCGVDLIVFHCTDTSMSQDAAGEARIEAIVRAASGVAAITTSRLVREALAALGMRRVVVLSPYPDNASVNSYLVAHGITVTHDVALNLPAADFTRYLAADWVALALANDRADADGFFLGCANTTQIDAVAGIESALGKPVVNSNQVVLWGALQRLRPALGSLSPLPELGRLLAQLHR